MDKVKQNPLTRALWFTLALLPVALVGGFFTVRYQFALYPPEIMDEALAQVGSAAVLYVISLIQTCLYAAVCGFVGYLLADSLGLIKPFKLTAQPVLFTVAISLAGGAALALLDTFVFAPIIGEEAILGSVDALLSFDGWVASLLYGGVIEEVMLRLFFMTLIAWVISKIFYRNTSAGELPSRVFIMANILAALLFAAGHLPATVMTFGGLTPALLIRCFLLNGGCAIGFGWLYRKHGIGYAMLAHAGCHVVSKLLFMAVL